ncbi:Site-specific recombinase XerD [Granulicella rosea]|uniref:Site-specific recombinase XerD n=1 Tax=Granulicella rosea TaxID=474952 RepID=A0A239H991_9BACT|nr:site-specific integrase [Granulicella rosea]SNS77618.1 Site-specific recombinase XerD [Granulicella rosea]
MISAKKTALVWYCKTAKGWRRLPVTLGANNRIKHGYVTLDGVLTYCPEGRYEIRTYVDRKAVYKPAGTNAADAMAARDREANLVAAKGYAEAAGVKVEEDPGRVVLRKAALRFENDAKERGALEAAEVNRNVTDEFLAVTGRTYADEVTRDDVFKFYRALKNRGCGSRTVSNKHKRLRSFFRFCKLDYSEILPPTPKYDATVPNTYGADDRGDILKVADLYMRLVIELGMMCGLRDQEIQHLEWGDIRWDDSTLRVTSKPHWNFKIKDSEERDIPIPSVLLAHLKERKAEFPDGRLVVPTAAGKPNGKLLRSLKRLAKAKGLNCGLCKGCQSSLAECQQWTLHKLRRTYGTTLLRSGLDLSTVQKFMGHSDLASTMRYLQPATSAASQAAINAIHWG